MQHCRLRDYATLQVVKIAVPVFNGAKYQCERHPRAAVALALKQYQDHREAEAAAHMFVMSADARADAPRAQSLQLHHL